MYKIGICGHFGAGYDYFDGQTIKTKVLADELDKIYGADNIRRLDTHSWKNRPFKFLLECLQLIKKCENVIILPAQNGLKVFAPLFLYLNKIFTRHLHYVVIGGWLPELVRENLSLQRKVKRFDNIYVETKSMSEDLIKLGFDNVEIIPNFKNLEIISERDLIFPEKEPYRLCTFSRVMKEKGIEDAIAAVENANKYFKRTVYILDIYGQIDEAYKAAFENMKNRFPDFISYKGIIEYNKSTSVLKDYFALLFPTYYSGEGFAGTILDAFSAGVPVIATDWKYNAEIIRDQKDGLLYDYKSKLDLEKALISIAADPGSIIGMKKNCIARAGQYSPDRAISNLIRAIAKG